jgi:hypothetical protein
VCPRVIQQDADQISSISKVREGDNVISEQSAAQKSVDGLRQLRPAEVLKVDRLQG